MSETQTFANKLRQQLTDAALARETAVRDALRLGRGERLGETIELTEDGSVTVAEIVGGSSGTVWRHLHEGKPTLYGYTSRWMAILAAVGRVHGGRDGEEAAPYAARVLQVPQDDA